MPELNKNSTHTADVDAVSELNELLVSVIESQKKIETHLLSLLKLQIRFAQFYRYMAPSGGNWDSIKRHEFGCFLSEIQKNIQDK